MLGCATHFTNCRCGVSAFTIFALAAFVAFQVPNAMSYGTHDFRRGHAKAHLSRVVHYLRCLLLHSHWQDLQDSGAPLAVILAAGEWKGRAVVAYMDISELERDVALEASMLSDGEGDC